MVTSVMSGMTVTPPVKMYSVLSYKTVYNFRGPLAVRGAAHVTRIAVPFIAFSSIFRGGLGAEKI